MAESVGSVRKVDVACRAHASCEALNSLTDDLIKTFVAMRQNLSNASWLWDKLCACDTVEAVVFCATYMSSSRNVSESQYDSVYLNIHRYSQPVS